MGETVFMQPESEPTTNRLKTNLKVWVVYSSEAFHLHMKSELAKCRNLHLDFCSLNNVSETFYTTLLHQILSSSKLVMVGRKRCKRCSNTTSLGASTNHH